MFGIRLFFKKFLQKNEVINSYFESKSNPFSIFNKTIDGKRWNLEYELGLSLTLGFFNHYFWIQKGQFQHRFQILFKSMLNWLRNQRLMIFGEKFALHISDLMSKIQSEDYISGPRFATPTFCNSMGPLARPVITFFGY